MYKLFLSAFCSLFLISCSDSIENDMKIDRTNHNISDLLQETYSDTVFYKTPEDQIIGGIGRAQYFNEDIYLIDTASDQVLAFRADGRFKEKVGRTGRGPGEYHRPSSFVVFDDNLVLIDDFLRRILHYKYDNDMGAFKYHQSAVHKFSIKDICEINGNIWIYGYKDGNIIHRIGSDLETIELSGGEVEYLDQTVINEIARSGRIACSDKYIYASIFADNSLHVYNTDDGILHDKIVFEDIVHTHIFQRVIDGTVFIGHSYFSGEAYDEKGKFGNSLGNLAVLNNNVLIQYSRTYQDYRPISPRYTSFVIDPSDHTYREFQNYPLIRDHKDGSYLTIINDSLSHIVNRVHQP